MATEDGNFHARTLLKLACSLGAQADVPWEKVSASSYLSNSVVLTP